MPSVIDTLFSTCFLVEPSQGSDEDFSEEFVPGEVSPEEEKATKG